MWKYYVLTSAACVSGASQQAKWPLEIEPKSVPYWELTRGKPVTAWRDDETGTCASIDEATDYPFASHLLPICSPRLRATLHGLGVDQIQHLPINIIDNRGFTIEGYSIANVLQVVDCIDRSRSQYELWTRRNLVLWEQRPWMIGTFRSLRRAVFDISQIGQHRLFVLWGSDWIIVRDDVKRAMERAGISGIGFRDPEIDPLTAAIR